MPAEVRDGLQLTRSEARRIAVRAQLLAPPRPTELLEVVRHLTLVQADPAMAVAPSAQLVLWSRLGSHLTPGDLDDAVTAGTLVELHGLLRPAEDIALFRDRMAAWPGPGPLPDWLESRRDWLEANDDCRRDVLDALYDEGPLPASLLPDTTMVPWESSGWNNDRSLRMLIDLLVSRGEVAAAGWHGRERLWDLAERVYPDVPAVPMDEADRILDERRLRALGIARARSAKVPNEPNHVGEAGVPAVVEGVRGQWRVDPAQLRVPDTPAGRAGRSATDVETEDPQRPPGRTALLSPLDRLLIDRRRMSELFDFDYQLEMFKPAARRRWGYWAMPILDGDRLVGKLDAAADRRAGVLRINAVHEDGAWSGATRAAVDDEIDALGAWLDLVPERSHISS